MIEVLFPWGQTREFPANAWALDDVKGELRLVELTKPENTFKRQVAVFARGGWAGVVPVPDGADDDGLETPWPIGFRPPR